MNKTKLAIIIIIVIFASFFLYWQLQGKNNSITNYLNPNKIPLASSDITMQADPLISSDISERLNTFSQNNLIKNQNQTSDICISLDPNKCNGSKKDIIFYSIPSWFPENLDSFFDSKLNNISITYTQNNQTINLYTDIFNYLKTSFQEKKPEETTILFTGDILPTRWVSKRAHDNNDMSYPFRNTFELLSSADYTIGDLECPFAETGPYQELGTVFRGDPELIDGLVLSGIDTVNLANNHLGDSQQAGMKFTFNLLKKNNIGYFGAGINQTDSHKPYIKDVNGIKIAILGYADQDFTPVSYESDDIYAGLNLMNIEKMKDDVKNAKKEADFVIVSMHAGTEYTYDPDPDQIEFAHSAIDAGADMIYGHHPHVVQAIETYEGKPIFYSLGNFVMDQIEENTRQGFLLEIKLIYNKINSIKLMPYHIFDWSQPQLVEGDEYNKILEDILGASQKLKLTD
jgi:poly-gamma-glutamate synthesis protein (capsule biosynthesis protein)